MAKSNLKKIFYALSRTTVVETRDRFKNGLRVHGVSNEKQNLIVI